MHDGFLQRCGSNGDFYPTSLLHCIILHDRRLRRLLRTHARPDDSCRGGLQLARSNERFRKCALADLNGNKRAVTNSTFFRES